jgi:general secretion pathway protein D
MILILSGCAGLPKTYHVNPDRMQSERTATASGEAFESQNEPSDSQGDWNAGSGNRRLVPLGHRVRPVAQEAELASAFIDTDQRRLSANQLPLREFVQSVLGEQLGVNYVIADGVKADSRVTLNISEPVSSRKLFMLAASLLDEQNLQVTRREEVFYIHPKDARKGGQVVLGFGRRRQDVPDTLNPILQIIPLRYGVKTSLERNLQKLTSAKISPEFDQNAFFVEGSRNEILRVVDLVNLLDTPSSRGRYISLLELTYIPAEEFVKKAKTLLDAEGISAGDRAALGVALLMIPIEQSGAVALFAADEAVLERAEFWANEIDKAPRDSQLRYFIYHPRYSRARDLGQSIAPLIGDSGVLSGGGGDRTRDTQSAQVPAGGASGTNGPVTVSNENMRMTVDERSNSIIFYTQGEQYQSLLPIIRRLDVLPKQILLDATIAEVTLTDEFSRGFEFAFRSGNFAGGTLGSFGVGGGFNLNWVNGFNEFLASLSASTNLINVLSNPTLVVRDGVSASINVGNDIPTVGSTTINPGTDTQSTTIVYRKTGVTLTVTPTVNAQGLIVLQIDQMISNTSDSGPQLLGSPSIFERSVKTEVLAQSGQTILLGGLVSENSSAGNSHVPGLKSIPLLGGLFESENKQVSKTELVIFITPRVIDSFEEWGAIRQTLSQGLEYLKIQAPAESAQAVESTEATEADEAAGPVESAGSARSAAPAEHAR